MSSPKKNILICGLGPVGGFFVTYLTYKYPNLYNITVYEPKLGEFNRIQIFTLDPLVLEFIENNLPPIIFKNIQKKGCYVHNAEKASDAKCYKNKTLDGALTIRIMDLEYIFYNYIIKNQPSVKLIKSAFLETNTTKTSNKTAKISKKDLLYLEQFDYLISASGDKDKLGQLINNVHKKEYLSNGLVITFDPKEHKVYQNENPIFNKHVKSQIIQHRYRGFSSKNNNFYIGVQLGNHEITELQKFIQEKGDITHKNMPNSLLNIINNGLKKYEMENVIKFNTLKVSFFPIVRKYSTIPSGFIHKKSSSPSVVFMLGDSLTTPHFFSGMGVNSGIKTAFSLIDLLVTYDDNRDIIKLYNKIAKNQIKEIAKWARLSSVNMDRLDKKCQNYTKNEIYLLAKHNHLIPDNMSKREVCLSLNKKIK